MCFRNLPAPGVFPASIEGTQYRHPIHLMLGETEASAASSYLASSR